MSFGDPDHDLNPQVYKRCVRIFDRAKGLLKVRFKLHHSLGQAELGDIFLFNHFARMETFIPQYLLFHETGAYCRSVAAAAFFKGNDAFAKFLTDVGAVPNDHPDLLDLLAYDILHGRKIIVFPEGGMVKDRRVIDDAGDYSVFSRKAQARRKHHTGAARLALGLQIFKLAVMYRRDQGDHELLDGWAESLDFRSRYDLIEAAERPVSIVPANITFYPLRVRDNMLLKGAELVTRNLSPRAQEELIVEGNLLLKSTDMDIRLGDVLQPLVTWKWWERRIVMRMARRLENFGQVFSTERPQPSLEARACAFGMRTSIGKLRDTYMRDMYRAVTVNLSHLAAETILAFIDSGAQGIGRARLTGALYIATKLLQGHRQIHLHRSLSNPAVYSRLLEDDSEELEQFLRSATRAGLIEMQPGQLRFREKILAEHAFDQVRLENPIEVYANEVGPLPVVASSVRDAMDTAVRASRRELALYRFDDQIKQFEWDRYIFSREKYDEINRLETATADPTPFLIEPDQPRATGVVLVHGFLASPAETRDFGNKLAEQGFAVLGTRLAGHGTSPWDLRERRYEDWLASVRESLDIMRDRYDRILLIGFSTGGSLCAALAAEGHERIAGLACICTPLLFRNRNMRFVPLVHGANNIVRWLTTFEGAMTFRPNESEHPHINYRNIPVRGLYELSRLTDSLKRLLADITTPTLLIQSTDDTVVNPESANILYDGLSSEFKRLHWIESTRHGILNEDVERTQPLLLDFADQVDREVVTPAGPRLEPQSPAAQPEPESAG